MLGWLGLVGFGGFGIRMDVVENEGCFGFVWYTRVRALERRLGRVAVAERQVSGNGTRFVWYARGAVGTA